MQSTATGPIDFDSWDAFRASYDAAHRHPANRLIHHATHAAVLGGAVAAMLGHPGTFVAVVLAAFPVNWCGHWLFERNEPAFLLAADTRGGSATAWRKALVAVGGVAWTIESAVRLVRGHAPGI